MDSSIISIIIIVVTVISFVLEKIPLAVTAMLSAIAMGIFGCMPLTDIYAGFGSTTVMMVAGMIIVGDALFKTGAAEKIGKKILQSGIVKTEKGLLILCIILAGVLSAFLSNSATIAMFIPLIRSIALESKGRIRSQHVIIGTGMAAAVGGAATLVGSTPQIVAQGILMETEGVRPMGFWETGKLGWPLLLFMVIYMAIYGYRHQEKLFKNATHLKERDSVENTTINKQEGELWKQYVSVIVIILCVIGFAAGVWNVGVIGIFAASVLIALGVVDFKEELREMDWTTIIILGGAQGFAKGLDKSGGGRLIAESVIKLFGGEAASPMMIIASLIIISVVLTNFMSNTAVTAMLVPIALHIALVLGVDPITFTIAIVVSSQMAIATPVGTPCVTQTLVEGYRYTDYVKVGLPLTVLLTILLIILTPLILGF